MRTVNFILGPHSEQVKKEAQRYLGKWIKAQLAKEKEAAG